MTMVQQNFHFSTQAQYPSLGFVTAQEIQNTTNNKKKTEAKPWVGRLPAPSNNVYLIYPFWVVLNDSRETFRPRVDLTLE